MASWTGELGRSTAVRVSHAPRQLAWLRSGSNRPSGALRSSCLFIESADLDVRARHDGARLTRGRRACRSVAAPRRAPSFHTHPPPVTRLFEPEVACVFGQDGLVLLRVRVGPESALAAGLRPSDTLAGRMAGSSRRAPRPGRRGPAEVGRSIGLTNDSEVTMDALFVPGYAECQSPESCASRSQR